QLLRTVLRCLGQLPERPSAIEIRTLSKHTRDGYSLETFAFSNAADSEIPGYLAIPKHARRQLPAVLLIHGHGGNKDDVFGFRSSQQSVAERLLRAGFAVAAIDNYFSGERQGTGPDGHPGCFSRSSTEESSLFKLNLWLGRPLWGMMLRDQQMLVDYLQSRPEIDSTRLGVQGMSMGSTAAWWLAA